MRYFRLLVIVFIMALSYSWVNGSNIKSVSTHTSIQQDVRNIIKEVVKSHIPQTDKIWFSKLWTKQTKENEIEAHFVYSYTIPTPEDNQVISLEGFVVLRKDESQGGDSWSLDEANIGSEHIEFKEAPVITLDK